MHCMMVSKISKHLMLLFNCCTCGTCFSYCKISKHLMLLFNVPDFKSFIWMFPFQNISCYCLTNTLLRSIFIANISKHLMLLFNTAGELEAVSDAIFQNISCYCLTQIHIIRNILLSVFQNISCYCLTLE